MLVKNYHVLLGKLLGGAASPGQVITGNPFRRLLQLREHKSHPDYNPDYKFYPDARGGLVIESTTSSLGSGHLFFVVPKEVLHGRRIRVDWAGETDYSARTVYITVRDGEYDCSNDSDFPNGAGVPPKGAGVLFSWSRSIPFSRIINTTDIIDLTDATYDNVTVFITLNDGWIRYWFKLTIYSIEIVDDALGVIERYDFERCLPLISKYVSGAGRDYGYIGEKKTVEPDDVTPIYRDVLTDYPRLIGVIGEDPTPESLSDTDVLQPYDVVPLMVHSESDNETVFSGEITVGKDVRIREAGAYVFVKGKDGKCYYVLIARKTLDRQVPKGGVIRMNFHIRAG